jgi:hypothetical protein
VDNGSQLAGIVVCHVVQHQAFSVVEAHSDLPPLPLDQIAFDLHGQQELSGEAEQAVEHCGKACSSKIQVCCNRPLMRQAEVAPARTHAAPPPASRH